MSGAARFHGPAKVNLALSVGAPRRDGYHPICSWMAPISLADELSVRRLADGERSRFDIGWADDAPKSGEVDWPVEDDLTYRAHQLLEHETGRSLPFEATVRKRIPAGAGLGGGSSDAAAMLRAGNELFELGLPDDRLVALAGQLGSDVAFFLTGSAAIVTGVGERIEPAPLNEPLHMALILPPWPCPTGAVYRAFDAAGDAPAVNEPAVRALTRGGTVTGVRLFNDLARAAGAVEPRLAEAQKRCRHVVDRPVHVTGSGSAMFALAAGPEDAQRTAWTIERATQLTAVPVRTSVAGRVTA